MIEYINQMDSRTLIARLREDTGITLVKAIQKMNDANPDDKPTTQSNVSNKLSRGSLNWSEAIKLINSFGFDVVVRPKDANFQPVEKSALLVVNEYMPKKREDAIKDEVTLVRKKNLVRVKSKDIGTIIFAGDDAEEAAEHYKKCMAECEDEYYELLLLEDIQDMYKVTCKSQKYR